MRYRVQNKKEKKLQGRAGNVGSRKTPKINCNIFRDIRKKFCTYQTRTECNTKRSTQRTREKLLQFESMIAEIKDYIVGLEDKVTEITQKVGQKDWT